MERKEKILKLYYKEGLKVVEIASKCKISKQYVSKIIKQDERYLSEKKKRKDKTQQKKKDYTNKKMKEIRQEKMQIDAYMKQQHLQATKEISGGQTIISNRAFRKWNASAYKYNDRKKCYEYDKKLIRTYATPRYIK